MVEQHSGLTEKDLVARRESDAAKNIDPTGKDKLAAHLAAAEASLAAREHLKRVPEAIFIRDILPALAGELGEVDMSWWKLQLGSVSVGFLVVDDSNPSIVLFEHPPLIKDITNSKNGTETRPVGDMLAEYRSRVRINPGQTKQDLVSEMRELFDPGNYIDFIEDIARLERIYRHYGKSIITTAKPEFQEIINEAVAAFDNVLGPLIPNRKAVGSDNPTTEIKTVTEKKNIAYDDDAEASPVDLD